MGVLKGFILSSVIAALIFFFELAFFPKQLFPASDEHDDEGTVGSTGNVFWLYPLIAGSYYLASSWTLDVANATYKIKHGSALSMGLPQQIPSGFSRKLILESHRVLLVINYGIISLALQQLPWVGRWLSFSFMVGRSSFCENNTFTHPFLSLQSFIDAYYCYEQAWIARGWSLERVSEYHTLLAQFLLKLCS